MSNEEIPYQVAPQVEALQAERANAVAYGLTDRVTAIDKQLKGFGVKREAAEKRAAATDPQEPPKERRSKESAQVTAEAPKGNASREEWADWAKKHGATEEELLPVEEGGAGRDDLRAKYGTQAQAGAAEGSGEA